MTFLYLIVRYAGIPFSVMAMLISLPSVLVTDAGCDVMNATTNWMDRVITAVLGVIVIARLRAMYQGSRKIFIFLIVIFLVITIACVVMIAIGFKHIVGEELLLSGIYQCSYEYEGDVQHLIIMVWILITVWEVLALCFVVWIAMEHYRELRRLPTESKTGKCLMVLIKTHVVYFAIFAATSFLHIGFLSPKIADSWSVGAEIYYGVLQICSVVQKFVLGPRLILGVREYYAKFTEYGTGTGMTSMAFQEYVHVSTSSSV